MKNLLRKLHIGGGSGNHINENHQNRLNESSSLTATQSSSSSSTKSQSPPSASSSSSSTPFPRTTNRGGGGGGGGGGNNMILDSSFIMENVNNNNMNCIGDYNYFEEEFQVQLAMAMSVSDPKSREDNHESAQIEVAKEISLKFPSPSNSSSSATSSNAKNEPSIDQVSFKYWTSNVVNYNEQINDGFYDVHSITSNTLMQGNMPLLVDLQALSVSDNVEYEVVLVDHSVDPTLQNLERWVDSIALECRASELGPVASGLLQKIANLVVDSMGGPVSDADEMLSRWVVRRNQLQSSHNTVVIPIGSLDLGLSRHRALLFKVLADRINLPCRLVKGSYYTGTDDGAVNMIKLDYDGEYIIDLMGAPGVLIPAEIPTSYLQNLGVDLRSSKSNEQTLRESRLPFDKGKNESKNFATLQACSSDSGLARTDGSGLSEGSSLGMPFEGTNGNVVGKNDTEKFEHDFGQLLPSLRRTNEGTSGTNGKNSPAQKIQVKDVSKCVITAAQNPDFAQKLHALLLESSAVPPPDLFADLTAPRDLGGHKLLVRSSSLPEKNIGAKPAQVMEFPNREMHKTKQSHSANCSAENQNVIPLVDGSDDGFMLHDSTSPQCSQGTAGTATSVKSKGVIGYKDDQQRTKESTEITTETTKCNTQIARNLHNEWINSMLDEVAEWEIPWEDIQIGERIGIGSYGEVYRADWNGTEVAVKKFFDQDFSGDALEQLKCEVRIMLRLRHPNVVLFMGAVTRPPNLSILTEFLPRGSLCRLLHRPNIQLEEKRRLRMALDVAKGMNYLHTSNPTIVHRDLKSPNLLVDRNWVVKVCDFGLSRLKHQTFLSSKSMAGTPEYMAPEVLRNEPSDEKCDVYSFGVILWELVTLRSPWSGMNPMQVVGAVGFQNRRLEIPANVEPTVAKIIHDCWQSDPKLRPSFAQLMSLLKPLKRLLVDKT
ncbi:hypothetical protein MKW98_009085 [Papaver atlanticum]|uniref:non-specific serine/threonine protein kinase n=1 Tax=Papaver atlanticum TaxID=357466 RepID=A0AAD4XSX4_9MAGN|nr:hypothetical protein MKW98_009085 [Papaver atlanticum]